MDSKFQIMTEKYKGTGTFTVCRLKTETNDFYSDRFSEFNFATLAFRQLEKKQTNLRLEKFLNSTTEI